MSLDAYCLLGSGHFCDLKNYDVFISNEHNQIRTEYTFYVLKWDSNEYVLSTYQDVLSTYQDVLGTYQDVLSTY